MNDKSKITRNDGTKMHHDESTSVVDGAHNPVCLLRVSSPHPSVCAPALAHLKFKFY